MTVATETLEPQAPNLERSRSLGERAVTHNSRGSTAVPRVVAIIRP